MQHPKPTHTLRHTAGEGSGLFWPPGFIQSALIWNVNTSRFCPYWNAGSQHWTCCLVLNSKTTPWVLEPPQQLESFRECVAYYSETSRQIFRMIRSVTRCGFRCFSFTVTLQPQSTYQNLFRCPRMKWQTSRQGWTCFFFMQMYNYAPSLPLKNSVYDKKYEHSRT